MTLPTTQNNRSARLRQGFVGRARRSFSAGGASGFTLIELCVVLVIISVVLAIALPRYSGFMTRGTMHSEARRIAALVRYLSREASRTGNIYYLDFDVDKDSYGVAVAGVRGRPVEEDTQLTRPRLLPDGIRFKDVAIIWRAGKGQLRQTVTFYPKGENDEAIVHLSDYNKKRFYSLHIKPYAGRSVIYDYYFKGYREIYHK